MSSVSFPEYRRLVLKELENTKVYRNFFAVLKAFIAVDGLDRFTDDTFTILKACYELDKPIQFTAERLDKLTDMTRMAVLIYIEELKKEKKES